jgi:hypothetical protein
MEFKGFSFAGSVKGLPHSLEGMEEDEAKKKDLLPAVLAPDKEKDGGKGDADIPEDNEQIDQREFFRHSLYFISISGSRSERLNLLKIGRKRIMF